MKIAISKLQFCNVKNLALFIQIDQSPFSSFIFIVLRARHSFTFIINGKMVKGFTTVCTKDIRLYLNVFAL